MTSTTNISTGLTAEHQGLDDNRPAARDTKVERDGPGPHDPERRGVRRGGGTGVCARDPEFGRAVSDWIGRVIAHRLHASRVRLLDLYAPYGSGSRM